MGDASNEDVLLMLGVDRADEIIISINDEAATQNAIRAARKANPEIHILVRAKYLTEKETALASGANEVVTGEEESANKVLGIICKRHNVSESDMDMAACKITLE